ncbi:ubiquinone biosynthesis protein UbiA [Lacibacter luteus]|uniref:Ubiquinone biosynthesis protein UbiA n=2 Tax=Lacibacter luteus TaxID=2508719 RepID=A0A4Q1CG48_9BACT|nr:ubiquinone biosynthesis protein UbiA [Lacibacter luteus]
MQKLADFFKLVRWPNLVFIALTQVLFFYCVVQPVMFGNLYMNREFHILFWILCASSVFIAAAGYVINDYFDLNIDLVNKPGKMVVDRSISRRWAIFFHMFFSFAGVLMGFYIGLQNGNWVIGFANMGCVFVLWFYSTTFKKKLLTGNILISLLTAWVVFVVYLLTIHQQIDLLHPVQPGSHQKLLRLALLYSSFAFIITLIREVVKDVEDMDGDAKYGCKTMPIVWGVPFSKVFVSIWLVILLVLLFIVLFYVLQFKMWVAALYNLVLIIAPSAYVVRLLLKANRTADFTKLSKWIKAMIFTGILSMILFKFFA